MTFDQSRQCYTPTVCWGTDACLVNNCSTPSLRQAVCYRADVNGVCSRRVDDECVVSQLFNPNHDLCCGGQLFPRTTFACCAGTTGYQPALQDCCADGTVKPNGECDAPASASPTRQPQPSASSTRQPQPSASSTRQPQPSASASRPPATTCARQCAQVRCSVWRYFCLFLLEVVLFRYHSCL